MENNNCADSFEISKAYCKIAGKMPHKLIPPESSKTYNNSSFLSNASIGLQFSDILNKNYNKCNAPSIPINDLRGDDTARHCREERLMRCQIAALCRLIDLNGWTRSIYNHISARCPSSEFFLINPFGMLFHEVQASSLVKVDESGNIIDVGSTVFGVNKAARALHTALHASRSDVNCVIIIHLPDVIAVSCIKSGLLPTCPESIELLSTFGVHYHDYQGIMTESVEQQTLKEDLGTVKVLFLRSKGVAIAASSIPEAWYILKRLVTACQTQMRLLQLGWGSDLLTELVENNDPVKGPSSRPGSRQLATVRPFDALSKEEDGEEHSAPTSQSDQVPLNGAYKKSSSSGAEVTWAVGELEFEAQMRLLDSAGFRTGHIYRNPHLLRRLPTSMPWSAGESGNATGAELMTTDMSAGEMSGPDDVAVATSAGAAQLSKIMNHVQIHRQKSAQRDQWLSTKSGTAALAQANGSRLDSAYPLSPLEPCQRSTPQMVITEGQPIQQPLFSPSSPPQPNGTLEDDITATIISTPTKKAMEIAKPVEEGEKSQILPRLEGVTASRSATLPSSARGKFSTLPARTTNTLDVSEVAVASDDEETRKHGKKLKTKWGSFRLPSFSKKKKRIVVP